MYIYLDMNIYIYVLICIIDTRGCAVAWGQVRRLVTRGAGRGALPPGQCRTHIYI